MRILFIAPRLPLPADTGGKIRTLNILKQLAKTAKVHLVCFSFGADDQRLSQDLSNGGIEVTLVPASASGAVSKITEALFNPLPVSIAKYYSEDMETILRELNETNEFDAVHVDHAHMAHYHRIFGGTPRFLDEHNVEYKILERCAGVEKSFLKKRIYLSQAGKMKRFESKAAEGFSGCFAVSKEDQDVLRNLTDGVVPVHIIPNGVDTEFFQGTGDKGQGTGEEDAVVFTGSMDWFPNDDAAVYFCEEILPHVWKAAPDVKFYIVGKGPSGRLKKLANGERRVILAGRVDDVRAFVMKSKVFAVPLRIGGGTRLKILEAMSMEKAVVSTSIGAEGIDYKEDTDMVLADRPEVFAQKVVSLLRDSGRRRALGAAGRKLVLEKYDWNVVGAKLRDVYEKFKIEK